MESYLNISVSGQDLLSIIFFLNVYPCLHKIVFHYSFRMKDIEMALTELASVQDTQINELLDLVRQNKEINEGMRVRQFNRFCYPA